MKLSIGQQTLAALLARGAAAAAKKSPLPILNFIRIVATEGHVAISSSDQDRFAEADWIADVTTHGEICVDAVAIATLVGKHPKSGTITMELDKDRLVVSCGRSKVKLPTLPTTQFPTWADEAPDATFIMAGKDFERSFNRVRFAASTDDTRTYLQGVHLDAHDGSLHFVATDGHRLAISGISAPEGAEDCPKITVPSEGVDAALKVFKDAGTIKLSVSAKAISFSADNLRLSSRLIDGIFPDYTRIVPERGNPGVTFKRADFVDCLDRANVLVGEGIMSAITARPDGATLRLEARNHNGGEASEELAAEIQDGFQAFGFNPRYAAQFLSTLNVGELTIEQRAPADAHLIISNDAPDFLGVLMPVRISG